MDIQEFIRTGGKKQIPNPNYNVKSKKNTESPYITVDDDGTSRNNVVDIVNKDMLNGWHIDKKTYDAYNRYGVAYNPTKEFNTVQKQLAEKQGAGEKLWNALKQTVVSEIGLGTVKGFADIFDFITSGINLDDYSNPVSRWCKEQQEAYENANPIFADPDKHLTNGGLLDMGWIAQNLPSVASTITLMIPGYGVTKGISALGKFAQADKLIGWGRKSLTGVKNIENRLAKGLITEAQAAKEVENLSKVSKWINTTGTQQANELFGTTLNAASMRIAENYQEAQDTYSQMYEQAANKFNSMSDGELQEYLTKHPEFKDITNRDELAKTIAKKSADTTFWGDSWNFFFDFIELKTLGDVGKLAKNVDKTSGARKALRLEKQRIAQETKGVAEAAAEETAKESMVKNTLKGIGNFISDHRGNGKVLFSELSEGVEEAVNYVEQQEGLHYGNVMLDEEENSTFGNRLASYMRSSELYDSAFWGWMGGVLFQGVGGKVKTFAENSYNKAMSHFNNTNDSSKGEKSTTWNDLWETATTKRQVEEINGRMQLAQDFREKLDKIKADQNPYETKEDGETPETITSPTEKRALQERARDEYLSQLTMRAIDSGNFDDVKEFLRDDVINNRLRELGVIDENDSAASTESLIASMDRIADKYQDNLLAINLISNSLNYGVPMEYQQIIARDNTAAQIKIDDLDRRISNYETAAENHRKVFSRNLKAAGLDPNNDTEYKNAVFLVEASHRLGELKAQKKALLSDTENKDSLDNQDLLRLIDRQVDALNNLIANTGDKINDMSRLLWAHGTAARYTYNEGTGFNIQDTEDFVKFLDDFNNARATGTKESLKPLSESVGRDFELNDNEIVALFGKDNAMGAYQTLNTDIAKVFPQVDETRRQRKDAINNAEREVRGIREASSLLHEDYRTLAALNFAKIYEDSLINLTSGNISRRVQELDNQFNKARVKVKTKAFDVLEKARKTYGAEVILDYINNNNNEIPNVDSKDKKDIDDAITALDMQKEANKSIFNEIRYRFIQKAIEDAQNSQSSTGNQNQSEPSQIQQPITTSPQQQGAAIDPATAQNGQAAPQATPQAAAKMTNGKLQLTINPDGQIKGTIVADTDANQGLTFKEDANGNIVLDADTAKDVTTAFARNVFNKLFAINDQRTDRNSDGVVTIINPILKKEADESYTIVQQGEYNVNDKPQATASPTQAVPVNNREEGKLDPNKVRSENKTATFINSIRAKLDDFKRDPALSSKQPQELLQAAIEAIESESDYNKDTDKNDLTTAKNFFANALVKSGLISDIADVVVQSSVTEKVKTDAESDFTKSVDKLFDTYHKKYNLPLINGKLYINLEDVLRHLNEEYGDPVVAQLVYQNMINYATSKFGESKYVITDENIKSSSFIENVIKSEEERINETVSNEGIHRVNIDAYLTDNPNDKVNQIYRSLQANEHLDIEISEDAEHPRVLLTKNGVTVGDIPLAEVTNKGYRKVNMGFITEVYKEGSETKSPLKQMLLSIALDDNYANLRNLIWQYTFDKSLTEKDRTSLANAIYNQIYANFKHLIAKNADPKDIADFLNHVVKYRNSQKLNALTTQTYVKYLDGLFDTYYESYELAGLLYTYPDKSRVTIHKVTEGEPNYCDLDKNDKTYSNYDRMNYAEEALDSSHKNRAQIGFVDEESKHIKLRGRSIERTGLSKGVPWIVIPNGSEESHIYCFSTKLTDSKIPASTKVLYDAINKEWNRRVKTIEDKLSRLEDITEDWNNLITYLFQLTGDQKALQHRQFDNICKSTMPLLKGIGVHWSTRISPQGIAQLSFESPEVNIQFTVNKPGRINIRDNNRTWQTYDLASDDNPSNETLKRNPLTSKEKIAKFNEALNLIKERLSFNIDEKFVNSSVNQLGNDDLILFQPDGSVAISIPGETEADRVTIQANSFSELVINNSLVKANLQVDPKTKSNFNPKGKNQKRNRVLQIQVESVTSSPVEEIQIENLEDETREILNNDEVKDKASELVKDDFSEDTLKMMQDLHLLPENVIFAEDFNKTVEENGITKYLGNNAQANLKNGKTTIGNRWISMFNETGEFANGNGQYRAQAIRKLIHEQIHLVFNDNTKKDNLKRIKEIYDEFEKSLDNIQSFELKQRLEAYLFKNKKPNVALEEFLVESFTSGELAEYLNSVKSDVENVEVKDTLLQKIMKFLSEIFKEYYKARGWDASVWSIEKGSLREKEFVVLQKELTKVAKGVTKAEKAAKKTTKTTTNKRKNTRKKKTPVDEGQYMLDFDAADNNTETSAQAAEPEQKPEDVPVVEQSEFDEFDSIDDDPDDIINRDSSVTEQIQTVYSKEVQDIKDKAIADGTFMKAPNGNPTNLNERQWLQVRTKAFKDWFGDWTKVTFDKEGNPIAPENSSKIIDENGEPKVVYHYTDTVFDTFNLSYFGKNDMGDHGRGFYFTPQIPKEGKSYFKEVYGHNIMAVFLNIKNPVEVQKENNTKLFNREKRPYLSHKEKLQYDIDVQTFVKNDIENKLYGNDEENKKYKNPDYIGTQIETKRLEKIKDKINKLQQELNNLSEDYNENDEYNSVIEQLNAYDGVVNGDFEIVVPTSNQIKSATDNQGTFSTIDNNIRHSSITERVQYPISSVHNFADTLPLEQQGRFLRDVANGEQQLSCS